MNELEAGHERITRFLAELGEAKAVALPGGPGPGQGLPVRLVYVDEAAGKLVVGLAEDSRDDRISHLERLRSVVGAIDVDVRYVTVTRDACPSKTQECRPIRGGVKMNSAGTLSVVIEQGQHAPARYTIVSSHVVGAGVDRVVGQPMTNDTYGRVTVNPPLANRASDAALTNVTSRHVELLPYEIWAGPNDERFVVTGFNGAVAVGNEVSMQGWKSPDLREGAVTAVNVTINDTKYGILRQQVLTDYPAETGDSGGPVLNINDTDNSAIYLGIHVGRIQQADLTERSFFSTWESIRNELGIALVNVPGR
jgi:hypothetical protein